MKKISILFLLAIFGCNCNNKQIRIKNQTINELTSFNFSLPSPDIALFLFIRSSDGYIARVNIITLHDIFIIVYSKSHTNFSPFLSGVLDETILIDSEILKNKEAIRFTIDKKIMQDYYDMPLSKFQIKYCDIISIGRFGIKKKYLNAENLNSILYYFFISNYKVLPNDYLGNYVVLTPDWRMAGSVRHPPRFVYLPVIATFVTRIPTFLAIAGIRCLVE